MPPEQTEHPWFQDYPPGVPHSVELRHIGLGELLRQTAAKFPDNKAVVFLDSVLTYQELDRLVDRFAASLHKLGLRQGDVVALMLPNSHQFVVAFYACQRLGLTVTAINPTYKPLEVRHQLNDSGAVALVVLDAVFQEQVGSILDQTGVKHLIGTNIVDLCGLSAIKRFLGRLLKKIPTGPMPGHALKFMQLLEGDAAPPRVDIDTKQDIAVLQYTGGTTGTPKGAMLSAHNLVANLDQGLAWVGESSPQVGWVGVLPLFHVFAMTCCMNFAMATGGFQLLFPRPPADMRELAAQIEKWGKGTMLVMAGVAALFNKINQTPGLEKYDLSPLKKCLSGAGPLPRQVQLDFEEKTGAQVVEGYGLSETSPVVTANPFDLGEGVKRVLGSIGLPIPNTECRIVDLEHRGKVLPLGKDNIGELCVRGPQVMQGYWNNPAETTQALTGGWFHTGDVACMDEQGWIYIKDRARDLVKHHGYSVFPQEVEDYLYSHPAVSEVAVVGLPKPDGDEHLKAYIVLKPDQPAPGVEEIIAWCKENIAHDKVPDVVEFRAELPKTIVGKMLRRVLRDEEMGKKQPADA